MASLRCNTTILALTSSLLCSLPLDVRAAPEQVVTAGDAPKGQRTAYIRGKQAAQRDDAEGAVEAWGGVLNATPESIKTRRFRMNLVVDTVYVALDAHTRQPNRPLLERALDIYYAYFSAYEAQYGNPNIPRPVVNARFDLKAALETAERAAPPVEVAETTQQTAPEPPARQPESDGSASIRLSTSDRSDGVGLLIAGGVTMAVGAGLTSLIAVGAINGKQTREDLDNPAYSAEQRSRIDAEGKKANTMFIAGLISAPIALATGAVLVGLGAKRRVDSRRGYAHVAPAVSRSFAGLQIQGRF
ncbi:MAG: hypothetical protein ACRBN8_33110 [Nannocystales bacterium]